MSAWVEGKLEICCSLDILKKAIVNIVPEWEKYILTDPEGNIPMYRYNGQREYNGQGGNKTVHLLIPGSGHKGVNYPKSRQADNDWGFKRNKNGTWDATYADYGLERAQKLEKNIKAEIAKMKIKKIAELKGFNIVASSETATKKIIDIEIDTDNFQLLS